MGYSGVNATLMSVPPFSAGTAGLIVIVFVSDHLKERSLLTVFGMALGLIGCLAMQPRQSHNCDMDSLMYVFLVCLLEGLWLQFGLQAIHHGRCVLLALKSVIIANDNLQGSRAIVLGLNGWSNIAGVIAGQLFKPKYAPSYQYPLVVTIILLVVGMFGFCVLRGLYMLENRRRREETAVWDEARFNEEVFSDERRGDQRYTWIYSYY
jgi:hypothetical protein